MKTVYHEATVSSLPGAEEGRVKVAWKADLVDDLSETKTREIEAVYIEVGSQRFGLGMGAVSWLSDALLGIIEAHRILTTHDSQEGDQP